MEEQNNKYNSELVEYINNNKRPDEWHLTYNPRLFEKLFDWVYDNDNSIVRLYYSHFWGIEGNNAPFFSRRPGDIPDLMLDGRSFIVKGTQVGQFEVKSYGCALIEAPVTGIMKINIPYKLLEHPQIPDDTFILEIDFSESSINKYKEDKQAKEDDHEKWKIRKKILEKERKKQLEKEVYKELIDEGLIFNKRKSNEYNREPIPQDVQDKVWNRDGGRCVICGGSYNLEFDHIIPISKGGATTYRNLQLLCENCNREKSNKIG